jgi:hypothetical protein
MQLLSDMTVSSENSASDIPPSSNIRGYLWYVYSNHIEEVK